MRHRSWIDFLLRVLPIAAWKDALIRGHVERCPECGRRLATAEEARRAIVLAGDTGDTDRLLRTVETRIAEIKPTPSLAPTPSRDRTIYAFGRAWRWVAAAAGLFAAAFAIATLVFFFRPAPPTGVPEASDADQIQIHYVRIADEPAQTFIFKPHDSDVVIIWAGKTH
jgi:hypothetical protein